MVGIKPPSLPKIWRFSSAHFQRRIIFETNNLWYNVLEGIQNRIGATVDTTDQESSRLSSNTAEALSRNSFFQLRSRFGRFGRKAADVLSSLQLMVQIMQKIDMMHSLMSLHRKRLHCILDVSQISLRLTLLFLYGSLIPWW